MATDAKNASTAAAQMQAASDQQTRSGGSAGHNDLDPSMLKVLVIHSLGEACEELTAILRRCRYVSIRIIDNVKLGLRILTEDPDCVDMVIAEYSKGSIDEVTAADAGDDDDEEMGGGSDSKRGRDKLREDAENIDGLKFLKRLRRNVRIRNVPVVLTAKPIGQGDKVRRRLITALHYGAVEFLEQPFRESEVSNLWTHVWRRRNGMVYRNEHNDGHKKRLAANAFENEEVGFTDPSHVSLDDNDGTKDIGAATKEVTPPGPTTADTRQNAKGKRPQNELDRKRASDVEEKRESNDEDGPNEKDVRVRKRTKKLTGDKDGIAASDKNAKDGGDGGNSNGSDSGKKASHKSGSAFKSYETRGKNGTANESDAAKNNNVDGKANTANNNCNGSEEDGVVNGNGNSGGGAKRTSPSGSGAGDGSMKQSQHASVANNNNSGKGLVPPFIPIIPPQVGQHSSPSGIPHPAALMNGFLQGYNALNYQFWSGALPVSLHQQRQQTILPATAPPNMAGHLAAYYATASAQHMLQSIQTATSNGSNAVLNHMMGTGDGAGVNPAGEDKNSAVPLQVKRESSADGKDDDGAARNSKRPRSTSDEMADASVDHAALLNQPNGVYIPNGAAGCARASSCKIGDVSPGRDPQCNGSNTAMTSSGACGYVIDEETGAPIDPAVVRANALNKYRQKRSQRCFHKKIRYESRKQLANSRPRVRGQFVSYSAGNSKSDGGSNEGDKADGVTAADDGAAPPGDGDGTEGAACSS